VELRYAGKLLSEGVDYQVTYEDNVNVGTAGVTVTGKGRISGTTRLAFDIGNAVAVVVKPQARKLTFNGSAQPLVTPGSTSVGSIGYALSEDGPFGPDVPKATNAGTYTIWWRIEGDPNISNAAQPINGSIAKTSWSISGTAAKISIKYKTSIQALPDALKVQSNADKLTYKVSGCKYVTINAEDGKLTMTKPCPAGTYNLKVTISAAGDKNHKPTSSYVSTKLTVAKAKNTLSVNPVGKTQTVSSTSTTKLKARKVFTVRQNVSKGKLTYKKVSGDSHITISTAGALTVKPGLRKGSTYTFKVKVSSAATKNYKAASKIVTFAIKAK
jgi:hypothetical protein